MNKNKAIFIILAMLVITLAMLFYVKSEGEPVLTKQPEKHEIRPQNGVFPQINAQNSQKQGTYLKISFLDIGQGDASFIEWPDGKQMLVDCGRDARILEALGRVMSFYDKTIDYLLVTHPDLDHYGGCTDILKRFDVENIIYTGLQKEDKSWQYFWQTIGLEGADYKQINSEQKLQINNSVLHFFYPDSDISGIAESDNNSSIVFKLVFGQSDILFTADAEEDLEKYLIENYSEELDVEVLKVGHHGSGSSSIPEFLGFVTPDISVISVGQENNYGHPSRRVIKRLERTGSEIWRTDLHGDVILQVYEDKIEKF